MADHRRAVELLALGEPLALGEIGAMTSEDTLLEAESHGLIATERRRGSAGSSAVRRGGPCDAARRSGPGAYGWRWWTSSRPGDGFGPDDALRAARLRLDAGVALSAGLALDAARAANRAGDPDLGAELAELAGADGDLAAGDAPGPVTHDAQPLRARRRQRSAAVEPLAPGDPNARDYLRQRLWLYHWGLRRTADIGALLDRAQTWSEDAELAPVHSTDPSHIRGTQRRVRDAARSRREHRRSGCHPTMPDARSWRCGRCRRSCPGRATRRRRRRSPRGRRFRCVTTPIRALSPR